MLRPVAIPSGRPGEFDDLRHLEAHFALDDFMQGNVGRA
jgi:hypothetical protein